MSTTHAVSHAKTTSYELCQNSLIRYKKEDIAFLQRIIVIDETWVCDFELELKSQSEVWKGKKFTDAKKIPTPIFKGKANDDSAL